MKRIETGLGAGLDEAISRLDSFYKKRTLEWLVSLYDTELGGFYYSASARDYEGFLPDAESTSQIISLLYGGAVKGAKDKIDTLMPTDMREGIIAFVKSLESPDGSFYHPQWGKDVSDGRKRCDSSSCKNLMDRLGIEKSEKKDSAPSQKKDKARSEHLASPAALIAYLDRMISECGVASTASKLKGEYNEIRDAKLSDTLFSYLEKMQNRCDTGYWQSTCDSAAELYRVGALYNEAGRKLPRAEQLLHNSLEYIGSTDMPESVVEIHIAWAALSTLLKNVQQSDSEHTAAMFSLVRESAPEMINKTIKKLKCFKKISGGYSYYKGYSPAYAHGVHTALGINEGDVNATVIALHGVRSNIFYSLGLTVPPIWQLEELTRLLEKPRKVIKKRPKPKKFESDPSVK